MPTLNRHAQRILKAALACASKKGFVFLYARENAHLHVIDEKKMRRLEEAIYQYRLAKKKRSKK